MSADPVWDAAIIGGGPAGLACALWLGRYRRSVVVYDTAEPRNEPAWAVHGYPGIPDPPPGELRRELRKQARQAGATLELDEVVRVEGSKDGFSLETNGGARLTARRVVLAFGLRDYLPDVPGIAELYGTAVFHCPDCDGPEAAGHAVGVIGWDRAAANLALYLLHWSERMTLLTHGHTPELDAAQLKVLETQGVAVCTAPVERLDASTGSLTGVCCTDGSFVEVQRLFFHLGSEPRSDIAARLGCDADDEGYVQTSNGQQTSIPGVYAVGDITGHPHLAISAAADGVRAALSIHRSLLPDERHV